MAIEQVRRSGRIRRALHLVLLASALVLLWGAVGCRPGEPPATPPEAFLVPISVFPDGWKTFRVDTGRFAGVKFGPDFDAALVTYYKDSAGIPEGNQANHNVAAYWTEKDAHSDYLFLKEHYFGEAEWPWAEAVALQYRPAADEYTLFLGTAVREGFLLHGCDVLARYGRYISWFGFTAHPEAMSAEDLKAILQAIDTAFAGVEQTQ